MNILILSCGTRNKIVQYFKRELAGKGLVMTTDNSVLAPALYDSDRHFIVPRISDEGYLDIILNICKENGIKAVLSLIDPELSLLAAHRREFGDIGVLPVISGYEAVERCFNKHAMYEFLVENGFRTMKSYIDKDEFYADLEEGRLSYPVIVKPVNGSASVNIDRACSDAEVEVLFNRRDNMMIQEFMDGVEYGVDCYIDMISGEASAIFVKKKIRMRAGETDKSVSVKDRKLFALVGDFAIKAGLTGIIDLDIFKVNGEYFISEVNPRFGGGYPHAYESGVNVPGMIINNLNGIVNERAIGDYDEGVYMMKYSEVRIIRGFSAAGDTPDGGRDEEYLDNEPLCV